MHQISKIYSVTKLSMFRASSVPIIRSYLLYARQLVPLPSRVRLEFQPDSGRKRSNNLHETYQLSCVQQITPDDGHRRCPKHGEFYDKINFGYLMHLVGCFIRRNEFKKSRTQWAHLYKDVLLVLCICTSFKSEYLVPTFWSVLETGGAGRNMCKKRSNKVQMWRSRRARCAGRITG